MRRKKTLLEELEKFLDDNKKKREMMDFRHDFFHGRFNLHCDLARKIIAELQGKQVTYTDRDLLAVYSQQSPIYKILKRHKKEIPKQLTEQGDMVSSEYLESIISGIPLEIISSPDTPGI